MFYLFNVLIIINTDYFYWCRAKGVNRSRKNGTFCLYPNYKKNMLQVAGTRLYTIGLKSSDGYKTMGFACFAGMQKYNMVEPDNN